MKKIKFIKFLSKIIVGEKKIHNALPVFLKFLMKVNFV